MGIGETLAEARRQAGLGVEHVSQRTRIRETIIRGIERDDYSACGGDFYARGHIRSIARVVGIDPEPLVRQYDAARHPPEAVTEPDVFATASAGEPAKLDEPEAAGGQVTVGPGRRGGTDDLAGPGLTGQVRMGGRRRLNWATVLGLGLAVALAVIGYQLVSGQRPAPGSAPAGTGSRAGAPSPAVSSGAATPSAHRVVIHLTAVRACWVEFTAPGGARLFRANLGAGASRSWTFSHTVDLTLGDPGAVRLTVDGKNPVPGNLGTQPLTLSLAPGRPATMAATPSPAPTVRALRPASAVAFGPNGGAGDNPRLARLAVDGSHGTNWHTDWYTNARFGNLYPGTGLLLDMGRKVTVTSVRVTLGSGTGASIQLRVGSARSLAHLPVAAHAVNTGRVARLRPSTPPRGRYVLIWFTRLPQDPAGTFQARVYDVRVNGRP